jgi:hypothetical protein
MIFCARATRGRRRPSLGLLARLGVPVGGRVRKLRAVEDQSAPIPEEVTSELGGKGKERPGALFARRTRTMKLCSSDARSKGQPRPLLQREV